MVYKVIGLMSGSSLDGLDIAYVQFEEVGGRWTFEILAAETTPYTAGWEKDLTEAAQKTVSQFAELHTAYSCWMGEQVNHFIDRHDLSHKVHFIASHGHTIYHNPKQRTTFQLGEGAALAAATSLPVINDLRAMDVALGGQGAPIVPIGDRLLFGEYDYLLNIGGIANITVQSTSVAYDIAVANQAFNAVAKEVGRAYDAEGQLASQGEVNDTALHQLLSQEFYQLQTTKSLSNEAAMALAAPLIENKSITSADKMRTLVELLIRQICAAIKANPVETPSPKLLITGGGAHNQFLIDQLRMALVDYGVDLFLPERQVVDFKEAVVMALIGALRWREEVNVLASVTGAKRDSINGAFWIGNS